MRDIRFQLFLIFLSFIAVIFLSKLDLPKILLPKEAQHKTIASIPFSKVIDRGTYDLEEAHTRPPIDVCVEVYGQYCETNKCMNKIAKLCSQTHDSILRCDDLAKLFGNPVYTCWGGWE